MRISDWSSDVCSSDLAGSDVSEIDGSAQVHVNGEISVSVIIVRCMSTPTGLLRWKLRFDTSLAPDIPVVVRMNQTNRLPLDYYLFPRLYIVSERLNLSEEKGLPLAAYRFDDLDNFYENDPPP